MNILQRLDFIRSAKGLSVKAFAESLGVPRTTYSGYSRPGGVGGIRADLLERVHDVYPDVNPTWLLSGKGEPFCMNSAQLANALDPSESERQETPPSDPLLALNGKLAGDLLFDRLLAEWRDFSTAAHMLRTPEAYVRSQAGAGFNPSWQFLLHLVAAGVSVDFLLRGEGNDTCAQNMVDRVRAALNIWNEAEVSVAMGVGDTAKLRAARETGRIEPQWIARLLERYEINPGWFLNDSAPLLVRREQTPQPVLSAADLPSLLNALYESADHAVRAEAERSGESEHFIALENMRAAINEARNIIIHGRPAEKSPAPRTRIALEVAELREQLAQMTEDQTTILRTIQDYLRGPRQPEAAPLLRERRTPTLNEPGADYIPGDASGLTDP